MQLRVAKNYGKSINKAPMTLATQNIWRTFLFSKIGKGSRAVAVIAGITRFGPFIIGVEQATPKENVKEGSRSLIECKGEKFMIGKVSAKATASNKCPKTVSERSMPSRKRKGLCYLIGPANPTGFQLQMVPSVQSQELSIVSLAFLALRVLATTRTVLALSSASVNLKTGQSKSDVSYKSGTSSAYYETSSALSTKKLIDVAFDTGVRNDGRTMSFGTRSRVIINLVVT
ncbi:hypothetical protein K435DRAFT_805461 [Dendrothele bispora CBS 962.96]|uniref:Uncharacterized protein n=1 Tax=Dendrothele bispora (strain CBS 962.96) TaxID=1314807 RepID=A0A4S8LBN8_DENBC|nr:hypothetical protein K435DRAFT_805461 [Dendrothele bispora CBS 962.96]